MRSPELNQQAVEVLSFPTSRFLGHVYRGSSIRVDGNLLKVFGFDSLECHSDPVYAWTCAPKHQVFKFYGSGKVKRSRRGRV